jgi:hypothetical protein
MKKTALLSLGFILCSLLVYPQKDSISSFGIVAKMDVGYSFYRHRTYEIIPQIGIRYKSHSLIAGPVYCNDVSWTINLDYVNDWSAQHSGYSVSYSNQINPKLSFFAGYAWNDVFASYNFTIVDPDPSRTRTFRSIISSKEIFFGGDYSIVNKNHFAVGFFMKCSFLNEDFYFKNITLDMESSSKSIFFCPVFGIYSKFKS